MINMTMPMMHQRTPVAAREFAGPVTAGDCAEAVVG